MITDLITGKQYKHWDMIYWKDAARETISVLGMSTVAGLNINSLVKINGCKTSFDEIDVCGKIIKVIEIPGQEENSIYSVFVKVLSNLEIMREASKI